MTICIPVTQRLGVLSRQLTAVRPNGVKHSGPQGVGTFSRQLLPTDALGVAQFVISNVVAGSEVRLYDASGNEMTGGVESLSGTTVTFNYNVYASPATAYLVVLLPGYKPLRLPISLIAGGQKQTIYQILDPAYAAT